MFEPATKAELQEDAMTWLWNQVRNGDRPPTQIGSPINTPDWSEFEAVTPDGNLVTVRVELTS